MLVPRAPASSLCVGAAYLKPLPLSLLTPLCPERGSISTSSNALAFESAASVGETSPSTSAWGDGRRDAPGLAEGVSEALPLPVVPLLPRRASCLERLRITSDFIEIGRAEPCSLKLEIFVDQPERVEQGRSIVRLTKVRNCALTRVGVTSVVRKSQE